jgi:hypothetical protein
MEALFEEGFLDLKDSAMGGHVQELERRDFPYLLGLGVCKDYILDNPVRMM